MGSNKGIITARRKLALLYILKNRDWSTAAQMGGRRSSWHSCVLLQLAAAGLIEKQAVQAEKFGFYNLYRITVEGRAFLENGKGVGARQPAVAPLRFGRRLRE